MSDMQHLSVVDGAFLHLESRRDADARRLLALFTLPEGYEAPGTKPSRRTWRSRMHLAPVFTRKLALMPFDLANPVWIDDDDIDLDYHIRYLVLPKPGTMAQIEALVRAPAFQPARPQPPAVGVLCHRGPGRRPPRLLLQGAPRRGRRPGRRGAGQQHFRHDAASRAA